MPRIFDLGRTARPEDPPQLVKSKAAKAMEEREAIRKNMREGERNGDGRDAVRPPDG
jgi:hypothetical protein